MWRSPLSRSLSLSLAVCDTASSYLPSPDNLDLRTETVRATAAVSLACTTGPSGPPVCIKLCIDFCRPPLGDNRFGDLSRDQIEPAKLILGFTRLASPR